MRESKCCLCSKPLPLTHWLIRNSGASCKRERHGFCDPCWTWWLSARGYFREPLHGGTSMGNRTWPPVINMGEVIDRDYQERGREYIRRKGKSSRAMQGT